MEKLSGLILCGGKSSRMGHDKGLLLNGNTTWAVKLYELLQEIGLSDVFVSVAKHNQRAYAQHFPQKKLLLDQLFDGVPSPLIGLLSSYMCLKENCQENDILVLACDLQLMDQEVLQILIQAYREKRNELIYLLTDGEYLQPLAGIYTYKGLEELYALTQSHTQKNRSIQSLVKHLNAQVITLPESIKYKLKNFNTPEDL